MQAYGCFKLTHKLQGKSRHMLPPKAIAVMSVFVSDSFCKNVCVSLGSWAVGAEGAVAAGKCFDAQDLVKG